MGSDDLFRKRKARTADKLERTTKARAQSQRFLIVCEGTKTEPNYFSELVSSLGIRPQTVKIAPNNGSSPDRIVSHALKLYEDDALCGDSFDKVFCVFDRDTHTTFDAAVQRIHDLKEAKKSCPFEAITSSPCFEYWLLLHFGFTDQPFHAAGKKIHRRQPGCSITQETRFQKLQQRPARDLCSAKSVIIKTMHFVIEC